MPFTMRSTAFAHEEPIPKKYTGEGADLSPPLSWSDIPEDTRYFALLCEDPDAPAGVWVHWVLYDLPATVTSLSEGVPTHKTLDSGANQGRNSWGEVGYRGPMPPRGHGRHRYHFQLFALAEETGLQPGASRDDLWRAIDGKVIAKAELMGSYQR